MFAQRFFRPATALRSHVRRYATEPPNGGKDNIGTSAAIGVVMLAVAGYGGYYYRDMKLKSRRVGHESEAAGMPASKNEEKNIPAKLEDAGVKPMMAFKGGDQGFISLTLESVEEINHNTKKFRFHLPEEDSVSGLNVASALITKYKGPEME
ncbi:NADH-cytochrome b5 reductase, partial [Cryomyces antarcticus]